jgi:hypothetical protein
MPSGHRWGLQALPSQWLQRGSAEHCQVRERLRNFHPGNFNPGNQELMRSTRLRVVMTKSLRQGSAKTVSILRENTKKPCYSAEHWCICHRLLLMQAS